EARDLRDKNSIGLRESLRQFMLKNRAARGVRARLKDRPDSSGAVPAPQGAQGFSNGRGMMAKIIDHGNAADFATHLLPALDPAKREQRFLNLRNRDAVKVSGRYGHRGIADIEIPDERHLKFRPEKLEERNALFLPRMTDVMSGIRRKTHFHDRRRAILRSL